AIGEHSDAAAALEYGRGDRDVVELRSREPRIVGHQSVAWIQRIDREPGEDVDHACRHRIDVTGRPGHGLGDHPAAPVEHAGCQVGSIPHDRCEGRAHQRRRLIAGRGDQPRPEDIESDLVNGHVWVPPQSDCLRLTMRLQYSSTVTIAEPLMTTVDSLSSTIAGPSKLAPAGSR